MTEDQKNRLEVLREKAFREHQIQSLCERLAGIIDIEKVDILHSEEKDQILNKAKDWPQDKWEENLFIQTEMSNPRIVATIIDRFIALDEKEYCFVLLSNFFTILLKLPNDYLLTKWPSLIEADGDDIFCYLPNSSNYICIERLEEAMLHHPDLGRRWIYEVTFPDEELRGLLLPDGA